MRNFQGETELGRKRRARKIFRTLGETYPYAVAELDFSNAFELLVATVLSAQTTDVVVNEVTPLLFGKYPTPQALAEADPSDVQTIIKPTGFFRTKAENIVKLAQRIYVDFDSVVPGRLKDLVTLPGVGRKTANVVLGNAFNTPGITVDTHFGRLARRFGWTESEDPVAVEHEVGELFARKDWTMLSHYVVFHGRRICHSRKPACGVCPVAQWCPSFGEGETDPEKSKKLLKYEMAPGREELHRLMLEGATRRELRAAGYKLSA